MAYLVSQMRKNDQTTYMQTLTVTPIEAISPNFFGDTKKTFRDFALRGNFQKDKVYYLRFAVHKIPKYFYSGSRSPIEVGSYEADADKLTLHVLLKNDTDDQNTTSPEIIGNCTVFTEQNENISNSYSSFAFVFSPSKTFNLIVFRINRVSFDALNSSIDGVDRRYRTWLIDQLTANTVEDLTVEEERYTGAYETKEDGSVVPSVRVPKTTGWRIEYTGENGDICELKNLLPEGMEWLRFGYQSRPGSLIVVNREPIRVGRSGIYQINNGTLIKSFMIASPGGSTDTSKIDAFLLDYAYKG